MDPATFESSLPSSLPPRRNRLRFPITFRGFSRFWSKKPDFEEIPLELPERLKLLNGFPRTARFLAADPDKSLIIVRRFDEAAIRNLLFLEGRVATLEDVQKRLDNEDFDNYKNNKAVTLAASDWESFALIGAGDSDCSQLPESVLSFWCATRVKVMKRKVEKQSKLTEDLRDPEYDDMKQAVDMYSIIQTQIEENDQDLRKLRKGIINKKRATTSGYSGFKGQRKRLEKKRRELMRDLRLALDYSEADFRAVQCRWETAKALQAALKDYQEAVHRYQRMLKFEEPAAHSFDTLREWLRGERPTQLGTQSASKQFLFNSSMSRAYDQDSEPPTNAHATVKDRVSIGKPAAGDRWSRSLSKLNLILTLGKDQKFEYPEINYTPEKYIDKWVTYSILVFAAILVVGAIWFLWLVQIKQPHPSAQLGLLTTFIILFGFMLTFTTTASRHQVLAATAAYTAVLVVFVGSGFKKPE